MTRTRRLRNGSRRRGAARSVATSASRVSSTRRPSRTTRQLSSWQGKTGAQRTSQSTTATARRCGAAPHTPYQRASCRLHGRPAPGSSLHGMALWVRISLFKLAASFHTRCMRDSLSLPPHRARQCHFHLEDFEQAIADCTTAVGFDPKYVKAIIRRATAYEKVNKLELVSVGVNFGVWSKHSSGGWGGRLRCSHLLPRVPSLVSLSPMWRHCRR